MQHEYTLAIAALALAACATQPPAAPEPPAPVDCAALASAAPADTVITLAEPVAAGAFQPPAGVFVPFPVDWAALPAFCRVVGSIHPVPGSDIGFELWLPAAGWNGRFLQAGNGGAAGSIVHFALPEPLKRGYAVANTDTGHTGMGGDFSWVPGHPEALVDYQHRSIHELTRVGQALTTAHYARAPERAYFEGCSTGGRQALKLAQRYPDDYDAIIAGAPASDLVNLTGLSTWIENHLGPQGLPVEKIPLLTAAAIAACDGDDGLQDRVIAQPWNCGFDPVNLLCDAGQEDNCLSPSAVAAARAIYAGLPGAGDTTRLPGTGPGSEAAWAFYASPGFRIGSSWFRNVVHANPDWQGSDFDPVRDMALAEAQDAGAATATDPDLSAFAASGGKLLLYHGTTDGLIPYASAVDYYLSVVETMGQAAIDPHLRFYLVPGMEHCGGGNGAWAVDWLGALEAWDASGTPPETLAAMHPPGPDGSAPFSRPLCRFPRQAVYDGKGEVNSAASFACTSP